jgi:RNA polymerase sigma-70 factor (ECF subfamily)
MEWIVAQPWRATQRPADLSDAWAHLADGRLATLVGDGHPDAYGELVRRHQTAVYNVAYRLVGEREEALDLAQEAFVRAYHLLAAFDPARPFGPWINRIVTNLALNGLARRRIPTISLDTEDSALAAGALPDYSAEPERLYLRGEHQARLRQAILALPPIYRAVIELRHFQECSYEEIAATLAIPLSDVKSHLFRARRRLRQWLEEQP